MANKGFDINTRFTGLPYFETPYEMLVYYDEEILDGTFSPYKWQREILRGFGRELEPGALVRELTTVVAKASSSLRLAWSGWLRSSRSASVALLAPATSR